MEAWLQFWQNAEKNMEVARLLLQHSEKNYIGLSAFHAQQALEMAIKAYIFKFDFEKYIRIKLASDSKSEIEFVRDRSRSGESILTHFPISELVYSYFEFIESQARNRSRSGNAELDESISGMLDAARTVKELIAYIDPPMGSHVQSSERLRRKIQLWKLSLKMGIQDQNIRGLVDRLQSAGKSGSTLTDFQSSAMQFIKDAFAGVSLHAESTGRERQLREKLERAEDLLKKSGLPSDLVFLLIHDRKTGAYEAAINDLVKEQGFWPIIIRMFAPGGMASEMQKIRYNSKNAKIKGIRMLFQFFRSDMIWMGFLTSISAVIIFMLPHEAFGRYQQLVEGQSTEELYLKHKEDAVFLIDQCDKACKTIKLILEDAKSRMI